MRPDHIRSATPPLRWQTLALIFLSLIVLALGSILVSRILAPASKTGVVERPTPSLLLAIRDLARLETAQVHVEKIIDLRDKQSRFFGMIKSEDALLLVAVGRATVGIDLGSLSDDDVRLDASKTARFILPEPQVMDAALDETATYVYYRKTDLLARRNEQLESKARRLAASAIAQAAETDDVKRRARDSAEKELGTLARALGAKRVEFAWR